MAPAGGKGPVTIGAVVLAAGNSRRMGCAKLAKPVGGIPMLQKTLANCAQAGLPVLVVTGGQRKAVLPLIKGVPQVLAAEYAAGMSASLQAGVAAVPADWQGALMVLGDMPFVAPATLRQLADALAAGAEVVAPRRQGRRGNPVGFARQHFPLFATLRGDRGAAALLPGLPVTYVEVDDDGIYADIDTPAMLSAFERTPPAGPSL